MLKACVSGLAIILLAAGPAGAQSGINLSWDDCGAHGAAARSFACDANADSSVLVGSFAIVDLQPFNCIAAVEAELDLEASGASVPDWWMFRNPGSCRQTSLRVSGDFYRGPPSCSDWNYGCAVASWLVYEVGTGGANRARIRLSLAMPCTICYPVPVGSEIYGFQLILRHDRTVGSGACAGCDEGVCIVLTRLRPTDLSKSEAHWIDQPLQRNVVTWQGGTPSCPASVPVRTRTWGAVKALYR